MASSKPNNNTMSSGSKNNQTVVVKVSFHGYIETTRDSLLLFEACKRGIIPRIPRRLQDKERHLIRSGSIFCFDENESGIKRWTDGLVWSPSRILGNFLLYRELDDRKSILSNSTDDYSILQQQPKSIIGSTTNNKFGNNKNEDMPMMRSRSNSLSGYRSSMVALASGYVDAPDLLRRQREKALFGSLKTSYKFKKNGLIKKSMSLIVDGVQQHIISYYSKEDVLSCRLKTPSSIVQLSSLQVSPGLRLRKNFRIPNFLTAEEGSDDRLMEVYQQEDNNQRKEYSDFANPLDYNLGSFPSSFTSSVSSKINSTEETYVPTETSTTQATNDLFSPVSRSNNMAPHPASESSNSNYQLPPPITDAHLPVSTFDECNRQEILSFSGHQNKISLLYNTFTGNNVNYGLLTTQREEQSQAQVNSATRKAKLDELPQQLENSFAAALNQNITTADSYSKTRQLVPPENHETRSNFLPSKIKNAAATATASSIITHHTNFAPAAATGGGYFSSVYYDNKDQGQNPHQHLFSSSSFHAINHAAIPNRNEIATNAFMVDINLLLGTGWNEFELQM